ncbi:sodium-dependent glucose transporter 1A-like [Amblyomma americanum]
MSRGASQRAFADVCYQPQPDTPGHSDYIVSLRTRPPSTELWLNVGRTCNVSLGNLGMGLIVAMTGVALLDLGEIYSTSLSAVSQLITTRCVGNLVGSLIGGKLYDAYNTQVISILAMTLTCFTVLMIPLSGYLAMAHIMVFFEGLSLGAFGTGANVWIMKMWPQNSSPALQVFHLAFGIGCLVAPFIARPFLSTQGNGGTNSTETTQNITENYRRHLLIETIEPPNATLPEDGSNESTIYYAFGIASAFQLLLVASMTALYFIDSTSFKARRTNSLARIGSSVQESAEYTRFARITLALLCAYEFIYVAIECTTSQMLTAFAVKCDLHFSKPSASRLVAVYFLCFAASRLTAALVTVKVSAFSVLVASHVVLVTTAGVLLAWGSNSATALWAISAMAGIAQGPLNAAATAWVAKHINISNKMMSIVVVTGGLGSLSPPLLVGQFLDSVPNVFLYVCFAAVIASTAIFLSMCFYLRKRTVLYGNGQLAMKSNDADKFEETPYV